MPNTFSRCVLLVMLMAGLLLAVDTASLPSTRPSTAPATVPTTAPTTQVSDAAEKMLSTMTSAYAALTAIELSGEISGDFQVSGLSDQNRRSFQSRWTAPNYFSYLVKDEMDIGCDGADLHEMVLPYKQYRITGVPEKWKLKRGLVDSMQALLLEQDPSLLLAVAENPREAILRGWKSVAVRDGQLVLANDQAEMSLWLDDKTHLIGRAEYDLSRQLLKRGATDVKRALVRIDYHATRPNAPGPAESFAWVAPPGAREAAPMSAMHGMGDRTHSSVGQPAPAFSLKDLDGKEVSLESMKGNVIVLDFWATWCGPCRMGLPGIDKLYQDMKDKPVRVYGVNQAEPREVVIEFREEQKLKLPVLLDTEASVAGLFGVQGIPHTVVIDKHGKIVEVVIGYGGEHSEKQIRDAVEKSLNEP